MSDGVKLFTVPAGTKFDKDEDGRLIVSPPNEPPFTITIVGDKWPPTVIKTSIAPDATVSLTISTS